MTDDYETIYLTTATINSGEEQLEAALAAARAMLGALETLCASLAWEEARSGTTYRGSEAAIVALALAEAAGIRTESGQ